MDIKNFFAKLLLVSTFLYSGITQLFSYKSMQGYIISAGAIPAVNHLMSPLLFLAIIIDLVSAICILINYQTKFFAYLLGTYTLLLNLYFNMHFSDLNSTIIFFLELGLTGAFYYLALNHKDNDSACC
jgi:putative oxidoreductase